MQLRERRIALRTGSRGLREAAIQHSWTPSPGRRGSITRESNAQSDGRTPNTFLPQRREFERLYCVTLLPLPGYWMQYLIRSVAPRVATSISFEHDSPMPRDDIVLR